MTTLAVSEVVFATHDPEAAATGDAELHLVDGLASVVRG